MISENLTQKVIKVPKEELKWARLCGEYDKDTFEAMGVLREAGFRVSTAPVSGMPEPELNYDGFTYYGLDQIKKFAKHYKKTQEIWYPR